MTSADESTTRYQFASPQWLAALHGLMAARASAAAVELADAEYSMCEVFTDVPPAVNPAPGGRVSWHTRMTGGVFTWALGEVDDVQRKVIADWKTILPLAQTVFADDAAAAVEAQSSVAAAVADGKVSVTGDFAGAPPVFANIHDEIARLTA